MRESVGIVGAGVSGLTCGVLFAEAGYHTRIFAEETGSRITSAAAAAIWFPYDAEPAAAVIAWSLETFDVLRELSRMPQSGVSMIELRHFSRTGEIEIPSWSISLGARRLPASVLPKCFTSGFALEVPLTDTTRYLNYLTARFRSAGGEIRDGVHFEKLEDVECACSLLVNCAGVGARALVPDPEVEPHRGQVVVVPKIALAHAVVCDDPPLMYAIPRPNDCVFGGTNERSADRQPDPAQTARIMTECSRVLEIAPPEILSVRVGLRPFRGAGVCLRTEQLRDGRRVIHNYGHGGSGFTLSWGCARAVLALAATR
ncbi:MAG: FAD-dependent oxidoreductase [Chthoniobacterales bacterium]